MVINNLLRAAGLTTDLVRILLTVRVEGSSLAEDRVVIYMDDYRKAQAASIAGQSRYDEEVMCVNWNPAVRGLAAACYQASHELSPELPEDFSSIDADAFLTRVYALATQV